MSKKSRRRNRKILGALGALGALALMGRRRGTVGADVSSGRDGDSASAEARRIANTIKTPKTPKRDTVVKTPTTIQDSMPRVGMKMGDIQPKNVKSKRVTNKGEVYTIEGAKKGIAPKVGNKKTAFVNEDYIYQDAKPYTKGKFGTFRAKQEMDRGMLPPQLRAPDRPNLTNVQGNTRRMLKNIFNADGIRSEPSFSGLAEGDFAAKDGGRVKKKPFAKRGFGRAYKKGKR